MNRILNFFYYLRDSLGFKLTIKDFAHVMFTSRDFASLRNFESHANSYCMYIKSTSEAHSHCVEISNIELYNKIYCAKNQREPFFGTCYCGVREYVVPIVSNHIVLGAILVGQYPCESGRLVSSFERITDKYDFDRARLETLYNQNFAGKEPPNEAILGILQICADQIASYLSEFLDFERPNKPGSNQVLINTALTYIHANLPKGKITISDIASHCHCSESTLSHCFSENMGISIGKYILMRRISKAKRLLSCGNLPILTISEKCGFGSAEHFSNSFKLQTGVSPANYRSQLQQKSNENI